MHKKIDFISFSRGVAISSIIIMHYLRPIQMPGIVTKALIFCGAGVHLFFFISGFTLTLSENVSIINFFKKRFIQILIPYYIVVTAVFIIEQFYRISSSDTLYAYLGHLFLFRMFDNRIYFSFGYEFWFIATLIQLYLAFPFLQKLLNKTGPTAFLGFSCIVSALWWMFLIFKGFSEVPVLSQFFLQYLWEFALGMYFSIQYKNKGFSFWEKNLFFVIILAFLGIVADLLFISKGGSIGKIINDVPAFIGYTSVVIITYAFFKRVLSWFNTFFITVGTYSYSLYLVHGVLLSILLTIWNRKLTPLRITILFALLPIIGFLFHYFIASTTRLLLNKNA
jgi:peptidoglycan/LPS O-acetylase OafA/YrhL